VLLNSKHLEVRKAGLPPLLVSKMKPGVTTFALI
jgi:hypothetical protein